MNPCAVCGDPTDTPEHWGRHVCEACASQPILYGAQCERADCQWTATAEGRERKRGAAKQHIQMKCNNHEQTMRVIRTDSDHTTEWWEVNNPDIESETDQ